HAEGDRDADRHRGVERAEQQARDQRVDQKIERNVHRFPQQLALGTTLPRARPAPSPTRTPACRGSLPYHVVEVGYTRLRLGEGWGEGWKQTRHLRPPLSLSLPHKGGGNDVAPLVATMSMRPRFLSESLILSGPFASRAVPETISSAPNPAPAAADWRCPGTR